MTSSNHVLQPAVFISHGSPLTALEKGPYANALADFGRSIQPKVIAVVSAHWQDPAIRITSGACPELIYDFGGFPRELYELKYNAPGSPELAAQLAAELKQAGFHAELDPHRGWDHGVWVPLRLMFPDAQIPVIEISLPMRPPQQLYEFGQALASLRSRGILVMGSGGIVHNLRLMNWGDKNAPADTWAVEFETWVRDQIVRRDLTALFDYEKQAPHAKQAVPSPEHFAPLFAVIGAADESAKLVPVFEGIEHANMSMYSFAMIDG